MRSQRSGLCKLKFARAFVESVLSDKSWGATEAAMLDEMMLQLTTSCAGESWHWKLGDWRM